VRRNTALACQRPCAWYRNTLARLASTIAPKTAAPQAARALVASRDQPARGARPGSNVLRDPLPDLVVDRARLQHEIVIRSASFSTRSCASLEGCVAGVGERRLLRFSVAAIHQGQADLIPPDPSTRPDGFEWGACHGHYHDSGFALYELRDAAGALVMRGRKQAYCMEDSYQVHRGPNVGCSPRTTCESQGIQAGWADVYGNDLDCQWIDITTVPAGSYFLAVTLNPTRTFEEVTYANNTAVVPVTIP
jgi:hypothetical protein